MGNIEPGQKFIVLDTALGGSGVPKRFVGRQFEVSALRNEGVIFYDCDVDPPMPWWISPYHITTGGPW